MRDSGWRHGDISGWALALGIVVVSAITLGLASAGPAGIVAAAVVLLGVIGLFRLFVAVDVPAREVPAEPGDQPG